MTGGIHLSTHMIDGWMYWKITSCLFVCQQDYTREEKEAEFHKTWSRDSKLWRRLDHLSLTARQGIVRTL